MGKPAVERSILPITVGTAGHIDHGKTTLLRALADESGDTDRLSEERERGLTIDVGYAELSLEDGVEVGVVDVPGHERFIRNMVAGATGIDVVMLVIAADDSVMPQTREHLQIMSLLGLRSGVVVITKSDTVDAEMVELVASEAEDLVRGTFLEGARILPVSGLTGAGVPELRSELSRLVREAPRRDPDGFFRMPILRVFTSAGFGTIVTGIPVSGRLELGERVHVEPSGRQGRVRGLQVYHRAADQASAGHRTAINLAELEHHKVRRGDVVCATGAFDGAELLDAKVQLLATVQRPLRHNQELRMHVGTLECAARVLLVGKKTLEPGGWAWAQLKLDRPAVVAPGDRFILRAPSHVATLGGGVLLGAGTYSGRRRKTGGAREFEERERGLADLGIAVESQLRRAGLQGTSVTALAKALLRRPEEVESKLDGLRADGRVVDMGRNLLVHGDEVARGEEAIVASIRRFHEKYGLALGMRKALLPDALRAAPPVVDGLLGRLRAADRVESLEGGQVRLQAWRPQLSAAQQGRYDEILSRLAADPWQTPRSSELPGLVGGLAAEVDQLLTLLESEGRVLRLKDGVVLLADVVEDAKTQIAAHIHASGHLTPADVKSMFGATRKYGIPLLEHLDAIGFTRRQGDRRVLRET